MTPPMTWAPGAEEEAMTMTMTVTVTRASGPRPVTGRRP